MFFEVHVKKRRWIRVLQIVYILIAAAILAAGAWLVWLKGSLLWLAIDSVTNHVTAFVAGIFVVSIVLPAAIVIPICTYYRERRPRIWVNGSEVAFYPLWRPAKKVMLWEITKRTVEGDTTSEQIDAAVGTALLNPMVSTALQQRYAEAQQSPKWVRYTYCSGNKKLIAVSTKQNLENLERFDRMVLDQLEGKPLAAEPEGFAEERKPMKKPRSPFVLAAIIGVMCVAAVAAIMGKPGAEPQSPDLLAGTSWRSADDDSQWVFNADKTFYWYQRKGETDDNYFAGAYEFHIGRDAVDYLTGELSHYGITEGTIQWVISNNPEYALDDFVCFTCVNQSFMLRGEEQLSEDALSSYLGFLLEGGTYLDIANMTTGAYYGFRKE